MEALHVLWPVQKWFNSHLNRVNMRSALPKSTWMTSQRVEDNIFPTENCPNKIVLTTKTSLFPPVGKRSVKIIFPSENQVSNIAREYDYCITHYGQFSWSLNMILPSVLRHCRLRVKKSAQTVKIEWWGVGDWCGYLSGARCRWSHPANATAITKPHHILPHFNPDWFYLSDTSLPRLSWKRGR